MLKNSFLVILIILLINCVFATTSNITLNATDQRYVRKSDVGIYNGPYTSNKGAVGVDIDNSVLLYHRTAVTFNPSGIEDYAFINSADLKTQTDTNPANALTIYARQMSSQPSTLSKESLYADVGNGTVFGSKGITTSGLGSTERMPLNDSCEDYIEANLDQNWVAFGVYQTGDEDETDDTYTETDFDLLYLEKDIRMSTSGTLSEDEKWGGSHSLSGNVSVPSGKTLTLWENLNLSLGSYYVKSTGGSIAEQGGVSVSPNVCVKDGSTIKGYYPSLTSAIANVSSGETISVYSNQTISGTQTVPSGVTLELKGGTITLASGASIVSSSGSIDIDGATVSPNIQVKASSNTIYGLYKTVQAALNATTATADYVSVYGGTYQENVSIGSGKSLYGYNNACIDGNVSLSSCTASDLSGLWVTGNVQISYGSYVYLENLTMSGGRIDVDAGSGHTIDDVSCSNSAYIDLYQTSPEIYDVTSTNSTSYSVYAYQASPDICSGSFSYKTNAVYCASYADATVDGNFCNNTYDIFAGTGSDVDATGVNTFSDSDSADCIHTLGSPV